MRGSALAAVIGEAAAAAMLWGPGVSPAGAWLPPQDGDSSVPPLPAARVGGRKESRGSAASGPAQEAEET